MCGGITRRFFVSLCVTVVASTQVWAIGAAAIGDEILSARSIGQGQTGVAGQSEDPAVVYLNPGAMTALPGTQLSLGMTGVDLNPTYRSDAGVESKGINTVGVVPNLAVTQSLFDERFSVGLAVEVPYGFKTHWPSDGPLRYTATDANLYMVDVSPALAYRLTSQLSLGLAGDFFDVYDVQQAHQIANPDGAPDGTGRISGQGTGWGMHVGLMVTPTAQHSFGLVYHDKVKLTIKGSAELSGLGPTLATLMGGTHYQTAAYTAIFIPQNVQLGYAYRPTAQWLIEVNTAWYDWDSGRDLNVRYAESDPTRAAILNSGNPTVLDRRSAWSAVLGANYVFSPRWQWRGGFGYLPHATPEARFLPAVNDLSRYGLGLGVGWKINSLLTLDMAYSLVVARERHITTDATGINSIDGTYNNLIHLLSANITLRLPRLSHRSS